MEKYIKTLWTDNGGEPINAKNLNKIESGIYTVTETVNETAELTDTIKNDIKTLDNSLSGLKSDLTNSTERLNCLESTVVHQSDVLNDLVKNNSASIYDDAEGYFIHLTDCSKSVLRSMKVFGDCGNVGDGSSQPFEIFLSNGDFTHVPKYKVPSSEFKILFNMTQHDTVNAGDRLTLYINLDNVVFKDTAKQIISIFSGNQWSYIRPVNFGITKNGVIYNGLYTTTVELTGALKAIYLISDDSNSSPSGFLESWMLIDRKDDISDSTVSLSIPYKLNCIKTSNNSNYTDNLGQYWLSDYIDFGSGLLVRVLDESLKPIEPQITELPSALLNMYNNLVTFNTDTILWNTKGAFMKIDYAVDTKKYIDAKFNQLAKAYVFEKGEL